MLVLRILEPLAADGRGARSSRSPTRTASQFYLQPGGPGDRARRSIRRSRRSPTCCPSSTSRFPSRPTEFTQVNPAINRVLVRRAMALLDPRPGERIADFFCGLGNFTLPIARRGAHVVGVEGSAALVRRAAGERRAQRARRQRARFASPTCSPRRRRASRRWGRSTRSLIDPPREGAIALVKALPGDGAPRRIVYVSCNPATLARDAAVLVHERGYRLAAAGVVNMFPHTAHVESIALFAR